MPRGSTSPRRDDLGAGGDGAGRVRACAAHNGRMSETTVAARREAGACSRRGTPLEERSPCADAQTDGRRCAARAVGAMTAVSLVWGIATVKISLLLLPKRRPAGRESSRSVCARRRARAPHSPGIDRGRRARTLGGAGGLCSPAYSSNGADHARPTCPPAPDVARSPGAASRAACAVASLAFAILSAGRVVTGDAIEAQGRGPGELFTPACPAAPQRAGRRELRSPGLLGVRGSVRSFGGCAQDQDSIRAGRSPRGHLPSRVPLVPGAHGFMSPARSNPATRGI